MLRVMNLPRRLFDFRLRCARCSRKLDLKAMDEEDFIQEAHEAGWKAAGGLTMDNDLICTVCAASNKE